MITVDLGLKHEAAQCLKLSIVPYLELKPVKLHVVATPRTTK